AAGAAAGRRARRAGDRRLHAGPRLDLQRRPAAGGRARGGRRGAPHPRSGDRRRPSTLRTAMRLARVPRVALIAVAAALWGPDPTIRKSMSFTTSATTIVFGEHVILVLCTLPFLAGALPAVVRAGRSYVAAAVVIGAGSSAVAT